MTNRRAVVIGLWAAALCGGPLASLAAAQGQGHAYGHYKKSGQSGSDAASSAATQVQPSGTGARNFGSWLDDASVLEPGGASVSLGFSYWRTPGYREFDAPVVDGGLGIANRVQFGFSVPYYHASEPGGPVSRGLGDLFFTTKVQLRDPMDNDARLGLAVTPIIEVLSYAPAPDSSRLQWAIPVSLELQRARWRVYGSTGYFSRGAVFGSAAFEFSLSDRAAVTGSMSRSHSLKTDELATALGLSQSRTDVTGGVSVALTPRTALFGAIGSTISTRDFNSTTLGLTTGVAFFFDGWTLPTTRRR
ncbi:MAG TPA: hypothetical protein VLD67_21695 [Vicinamibacterales bacterium]|nr:hypothetical protein [Vicinamibacterales bacterium]